MTRTSLQRIVLVSAACGAAVLTACNLVGGSGAGPYGTPQIVAQLADGRITEASGIVASRKHAGSYYIHNDSGDSPRVFLVGGDGQTQATIDLTGAQARDYEDIALAPDGAGGYDVCVADIGDNNANRPYVVIYRFAEPDVTTAGAAIDVAPTAYQVSYIDGAADAEAFFVHPTTGDGYILTKRTDGSTVVYKIAAPWDASGTTALVALPRVQLPAAAAAAQVVTGADVRPDGTGFVVRCYTDGWEWTGAAPADFDAVFGALPQRVSLATEPLGETICYSTDGQRLLTVSEGSRPPIYQVTADTP